jgi:hypothetical protein
MMAFAIILFAAFVGLSMTSGQGHEPPPRVSCCRTRGRSEEKQHDELIAAIKKHAIDTSPRPTHFNLPL